MDEKASDLVETVEDHRVPPHSNSNGIVTEGQAIGTNKQTFRLRKDPDSKNAEEVDEVTEIC
jgi:hypothetical protein